MNHVLQNTETDLIKLRNVYSYFSSIKTAAPPKGLQKMVTNRFTEKYKRLRTFIPVGNMGLWNKQRIIQPP